MLAPRNFKPPAPVRGYVDIRGRVPRTGGTSTMAFFIRLTLLLTAAFLAIVVVGFVLKLVLVAALIAAVVAGGFFVYHFVRGFARRVRARQPVRMLGGG